MDGVLDGVYFDGASENWGATVGTCLELAVARSGEPLEEAAVTRDVSARREGVGPAKDFKTYLTRQ